MALDHDHCFLCGAELTAENRTDEHVFPKWLQSDFNLWNQTLNLLNGTAIPYRALTIPCCAECNNFWLAQVEEKVSMAFRAGEEAVQNLDRGLLALWMGKIYYGIHFKEVALPTDRRNPAAGTILDKPELEELSELHHNLQAMRKQVIFDRAPGSTFVFKALVPEDVGLQFDYKDIRHVPFLAIRAGEVIVMASILDWGAMSEGITHPIFEAADQLELHPIQFLEVAAFGAYTAGRFNREFGYLEQHRDGKDYLLPTMLFEPGRTSEDEPVFLPVEPENYAQTLATFTNRDASGVWDPDRQILWTNLRNADGSLLQMDLEKTPMDVVIATPLELKQLEEGKTVPILTDLDESAP
jgi:hypothetical protein